MNLLIKGAVSLLFIIFIMMFTKFLKIVTGAALSFVVVAVAGQTSVAQAQSIATPSIFISNLSLNQSSVAAGGIITGSFLATNGSANSAANITYSVSLVGNIEKNGLIADSTYDSKNFGPLFFTAHEKKQVKFSYTLPSGTSGAKLGIEILISQAGNEPLGWDIASLAVTGGSSVVPAVTITTVSLKVASSTFDVLSGPTVQSGQPIALQFSAKSSVATTLIPKISIYSFDYSGQPIVVSNMPAIPVTAASAPQNFSVDMSSLVSKPQVYAGQAVLTTTDGVAVSPIIFFRYIVGGSVYNLRSVTADKTAVVNGGTVAITVSYSGTPAVLTSNGDMASSSVSSGTATVAATLYNEHNQEIGSAKQDVDFSQSGNVTLPVIVNASANALRTVVTVTKNGVVVVNYGGDLSPNFAAEAQEAIAAGPATTAGSQGTQAMLEDVGFLVLAIFILCSVWYLKRRSRNNDDTNQPPFSPIAMLLAILIGTSFLAGGVTVSHADLSQNITSCGGTNLKCTVLDGHYNASSYVSGYNMNFQLNKPTDNVPVGVQFPLSFILDDSTCQNKAYNVVYYVQYGAPTGANNPYDASIPVYSQDAWGTIGTASGGTNKHVGRILTGGTYVIGPNSAGGAQNNSDDSASSGQEFTALDAQQVASYGGKNTMTIYFAEEPVGFDAKKLPHMYAQAKASGDFSAFRPIVSGGYSNNYAYLILTVAPITDTMPVGALGTVINPLLPSAAIAGWACDIDDPSATALVDIYMATSTNSFEIVYPSYPANAQNSDPNTSSATIASNCGGTTVHAFLIPIPPRWQEDGPTTLSVKAFARNINSSGNTPYDYINTTKGPGSDPEPFPVYGGSHVLPIQTFTPPTPIAPTASGVCVNNIPVLSLSWSSMTDSQSVNGDTLSQGVAGYQLQISTDSAFGSESTKKIGSQNTTQATISGTDSGFTPALTIALNTQYYARIVYIATGAVGATANATTPASCGSGGGGAPVVNFGTSASIYPGGSIALTWTAVNPTQGIAPTHWWNWFLPSAYADSSGITCTASNSSGGLTDSTTGWSGNVSANGSREVGPLSDNVSHKITFNLTCTNSSGSTTPPPVIGTIITTNGGGTVPTFSLSFAQNGNPCPASGSGPCTPVCNAPLTIGAQQINDSDTSKTDGTNYCVETNGSSGWPGETVWENYSTLQGVSIPVPSKTLQYTLTCYNSAGASQPANATVNAPTGGCTTQNPGNGGTTGGNSFPF